MTSPARWTDLEAQAPGMAAAGSRLLRRETIPIAFLATVAGEGASRISPVCPMFAGGDVDLSVGAHTAKRAHLRRDDRVALHAFLGDSDEEFQITGRAVEVTDPQERAAVIRAIAFGAYDPTDPIVRLAIETCLHVRWENVGRPDTRAIRARWTASSGRVAVSDWSLPRR